MNQRQLRYRGGVAAAVLVALGGIVEQNGALVLAAAVPLVYVVVGSLSTVSVPGDLAVERRVEPQPARPGELVTVTLTAENGTDRTLTDVRFADGVPEELAVVGGSPRAAATLEPGEDVVVEYELVARRGEYPFQAPQVRVRGLGAGAVATRRPAATGEDTLVCKLDADAPPIEDHGRGQVGILSTDEPGDGIAFHSVREHRDDDPAARIDWRHYAKRGELATVNYERDVPGTVVLVLDARAASYVIAGPGRPTAVEFGAYAATRALSDLLRAGHDVGVAVVGLDGPGPGGLHWLPPARGSAQRSLALDVFRETIDASSKATGTTPGQRPTIVSDDEESETEHEPGLSAEYFGLEPEADDDGSALVSDGAIYSDPDALADQTLELLELLPPGAQVALFSPLLEAAPVSLVETCRGAGLPVTVLSPDVLPENTVSGQYAQVRRRTRLVSCQRAGARVFDWRRGTPLPLVIEHAFAADARLSARLAGGGR